MTAGTVVRFGIAFAGVLLAGSVLAQGPGNGMGAGQGMGRHHAPFERGFGPDGARGRFWNNPKLVEQLKLTDEQRKAMDAILLQHREKLIDLRANLQKAELEMEPLMRDDKPNEAQITGQIDKVAQARAELEKANARFLLAVRGKLTPEQWKQVQEFRKDRGQEHPGMGPGGPGQNMRGPGGRFHRQAAPAPVDGPGPQSMVEGPGDPFGLEAPGVGSEQ